MSDREKKANDLMRKASESFAGGKMQKAYKQYGQAAKAYEQAPDAPRERWALALYTRAMFILSGDASGHVQSDLDEGDRLVANEEFAGRDRFRGLFLFARAKWRRHHEDLAQAQEHLTAAREILAESGEPIDNLELDREQARLGMDRKEWDVAEAAARKCIAEFIDPRQSVESRILLSEVFRAQNRMAEVLETLEAAASLAFDTELREQLWDLKDRIAILKRNHPELDSGEG